MVIVIWVLSLLTIMAGSFALTMRRETVVISAVKDNAEALAMAETGLAIAQRMLLELDNEKRWKADGSIYQVFHKDAEIRIRLFSERGKVNINLADESLLARMMESTSISVEDQQALVSAILDWRDRDELIRINGAEKDEYEDAGLSYKPANKKFNVIEELQMVLGMNEAIFEELQPVVTVYSEQPNVDLKVAPIEVQWMINNPDKLPLDEFTIQWLENNDQQYIPDINRERQTAANSFEQDAQDIFNSGNSRGNPQAIDDESVYTIVSQARLFTDTEATIKITIIQSAARQSVEPFQVLEYRQLYHGKSLFSEEMEQFIVIEEDESERRR